jgi:hypothetical protein
MAKLNRDETLALARIVVRSMNLLKGKALDQVRAAIPNDRQYEQIRKIIKDHESGLRVATMNAITAAGLTDSPVSAEELRGLK